MEPLVLQLQAECLDSRISILDVLRKALVVARKLSLTDAQSWIERELKGYKQGDKAPPHRLLTAQIRAWNPYHGWVPVMFQESTEGTHLAKCFVGQPVGVLEELTNHADQFLEFPFDSETESRLMMGLDLRLRPTRHLSRAAVTGILDAVRNLVLDWCLQLEKDGILGTGLTFSTKEKEVAAHSNYTINYNAPIAHSQVLQGSPFARQAIHVSETDLTAVSDFMRKLKAHATDLKLDSANSDQLSVEIRKVETQMASTAPSRSVLHESLSTIRSLLEGCAGSLIASGLLFELQKLVK